MNITPYPFIFDAEKAVNTVLYIVQKLESPSFHTLFKIIYFADKYHLEEYGRLIFGDEYIAMKHGPVPSNVYDILKAISPYHQTYRHEYIAKEFGDALLVKDNHFINALKDCDLEVFSPSDTKCLDKAINEYGSMSFDELTEISHDRAWEEAGPSDIMSIESIIRTLPSADDLLEHLKNPHP